MLWEDLVKDAFELGIPERPGVGTGGCFKRVGDAFALQQRVEFPVGGQQGILFAANHADGRQGGRVGTGGQLPQVGLGRQSAVVNAGFSAA